MKILKKGFTLIELLIVIAILSVLAVSVFVALDQDGTAALTKYSIVVDTNNIVTVKACGVEGTTNISISR